MGGFLQVVLRAQAMYGVDESAQVIRIDIGRYAVAQIEDMAWAITVACQHLGNALLDYFG